MLYIGIDLHRKHLTVSIRDEQGNSVMRRQVSTSPHKVDEFLEQLRQSKESYVVVLEVCGFHDWWIKRLQEESQCSQVILVQPEKKPKQKTDRRDASKLSETLWVNRARLMAGEKVQGLRQVYIPTDQEQQDRQLTRMRHHLGKQRTKTLNQIHFLLRRHNLGWEQPTKGFQTKTVRRWLKNLSLNETDRLELDQLLDQWELWDRQIEQVEDRIAVRFQQNANAEILATIRGISCYMALAIASRIGDISRFPHARSLANFFGLTPSCNSSGQTERLGSITKEGSRLVRHLLGQLVLHALRNDPKLRYWYKSIKRRRGSKIARVAVMRRLSVIMWHMLSKPERYQYGSCDVSIKPNELLRQDIAEPNDGPAWEDTGSSSLCPMRENEEVVLA